MKDHRSSVVAVVLPSGRELAVTGSFSSPLEDECGFLGHSRRRWSCAPAVVAELERLWSQSGLVGRPIDLLGLRQRGS